LIDSGFSRRFVDGFPLKIDPFAGLKADFHGGFFHQNVHLLLLPLKIDRVIPARQPLLIPLPMVVAVSSCRTHFLKLMLLYFPEVPDGVFH
jgi:hypothetical protein